MTTTKISNLKGSQGIQGPMGPVNPSSAPTDTAIAGWISTSGGSDTQAAGDARWAARRQFDVMNYGAKGDAVTDDTSAINAAIAAIPSATGGVLFFPPGSYVVSSAITLPQFVTVQGSGAYSTRVLTNSTTADVFVAAAGATTSYHMSINDIGVGASVTQTAGAAFRFTNVSGVRFRSILVLNSYQLGVFNNVQSFMCSGLRVAGPAGTAKGFYFASCIDVHWHDVSINGGTTILAQTEAWITVDSNCDTWELSSSSINNSQGAGTAIRFTNTLSGFHPRWVRLSDVWFEGGSGTAATAQWRAAMVITAVRNFRMIGGYTSTSLYGVQLDGGIDMSFIGVNFQGSLRSGVAVNGTAAPVGTSFIDCTFSDNSQDTTTSYSHALLGSNAVDTKFIGCYFGDRLLGYTLKAKSALDIFNTDVLVSNCKIENVTATFTGSQFPRGLGVGYSAAATTLGTLSKKIQVFDATGTSLGFVPVYTTIS